jgi:hypothetical protein
MIEREEVIREKFESAMTDCATGFGMVAEGISIQMEGPTAIYAQLLTILLNMALEDEEVDSFLLRSFIAVDSVVRDEEEEA